MRADGQRDVCRCALTVPYCGAGVAQISTSSAPLPTDATLLDTLLEWLRCPEERSVLARVSSGCGVVPGIAQISTSSACMLTDATELTLLPWRFSGGDGRCCGVSMTRSSADVLRGR